MGFGDDGVDIVLPLNRRHSIHEPVEFFGCERCAEARYSARDLATCGRDCLCLAAIIHQCRFITGLISGAAARIVPPRPAEPPWIRFSPDVCCFSDVMSGPRSLVRIALEPRVPLRPTMQLVAGWTLDRVHFLDRRSIEDLGVHRVTGVDHLPGSRTLDQYAVH